VLTLTPFATAQSPDRPPPNAAAAGAAAPASEKKGPTKALTVAVLDFTSDPADGPELGKDLADLVSGSLTGADGLTLVDRSSLARILQEHELSRTGLVEPSQTTKVGRLIGAKLLVTGKVFTIDGQIFVAAKIIGTETTQVDVVLLKGEKGAGFAKLAEQLGEKVGVRLREVGPKLVAGDEPVEVDPLPSLKEKLAKLRRPVLTVRVGERHIDAARPAAAGDPAVETELRRTLQAAAFTVIDGTERELIEGGVEVLVGGDAFSEFAARIGNLVSCSARVELKVTDRKTGAVLFSDRETARAADLSENVAAKAALEKAGRALGVRLLQHFAETLKPADAPPAEPKKQ
jgi:hypothetical protein